MDDPTPFIFSAVGLTFVDFIAKAEEYERAAANHPAGPERYELEADGRFWRCLAVSLESGAEKARRGEAIAGEP